MKELNVTIPTLKVRCGVNFSEEQYTAIKLAAKEEIPFSVNIRICKRKYAYNAIDIRPRGRNKRTWTEEEFSHVLKFVIHHGLIAKGSALLYEETKADKYYLYNDGFNFMIKIDEAYNMDGSRYIAPVNKIENDIDNLSDMYSEIIVSECPEGITTATEEQKKVFAERLQLEVWAYGIEITEELLNTLIKKDFNNLHEALTIQLETTEEAKTENTEEELEMNTNYMDNLTAQQQETLNERLNKPNVKPVRLWLNYDKEGVVLECINTNLDQQQESNFFFLIGTEGKERGLGYFYPTTELTLVHDYGNKPLPLEQLFHHEELTVEQNNRINSIMNHWKDSDKVKLVAAHLSKADTRPITLHVEMLRDGKYINHYLNISQKGLAGFTSCPNPQYSDLIHSFNPTVQIA